MYHGGEGAVTGTEEQRSWGPGGVGHTRDSIDWWRKLYLKMDKGEKRRDRRPGEKSVPEYIHLIF